MKFKVIFRLYYVLFISIFWSSSSLSAEFEESNILPVIDSIAFSEDSVGFTASMSEGSWYRELLNNYIYFMFDRRTRKIIEVSEEKYLSSFSDFNQIKSSSTNETSNGTTYETKSLYCVESFEGSSRVLDTRKLTIDGKDINLKLLKKCSNISFVEIVNENQLWIATYEIGSHGDFGGEGFIVQDLISGDLIARINTVKAIFSGVAFDPVTNDMWAFSKGGIYKINKEFKIDFENHYYHGFNMDTGQPQFGFSETYSNNAPFSVISRYISTEDRKKFYDIVSNIPKEDRAQFKLYDFYMCCSFYSKKYPASYQPLVPFFVKVLNNYPNYPNGWRQLLCRIGGENSEQYCSSE